MNMSISPERPAVDPNAFHYQEIIFSLAMTVVAVLSRDNPLIRAPEMLWAMAGILAFNLAYHALLRRRGADRSAVPLISMAVNVALVSLVLAHSGGAESNFWPLYLLPSFTACLYLERRHAIGAVAAACAFLALFYLDAFWESRRWSACEFAIKAGVLVFSGAMTSSLSQKERRQRQAFETARARIDALALSLERRTSGDLLAMRRQSMETLLPGIAHELNNPLTVIVGTVELMLREAPAGGSARQDLERIRAAAARCTRLSGDLLAYGRAEARAR